MPLEEAILIPGPSFRVDLPALDARHPVHYGRRLSIFRCISDTQHAHQISLLKQGLQTLVYKCPLLGGVVDALPAHESKAGNEDCRTIVPGPGLEFIARDLRTVIPSFEQLEALDFPSSELPYSLLVPVPLDIDNSKPFAACKVQYSAIQGGSIFAFGMSHSVSDGAGVNHLMKILTEAIRATENRSASGSTSKVTADSSGSTLGLDRGILRNMTSTTPFDIKHHPAYVLKAAQPVENAPPKKLPLHPFEAMSPEIPVVFHITAAGLSQLKADATHPTAPFISTHDALSALLWRSVSIVRSRRAGVPRELVESTTGSLFMPSDARRHLDIPISYVGNVVYQLTATLDLPTLLSPSGLQQGASAVRHAITAVKPDLVASLVAKTAEEWVDWGFMDCYSSTGVAMGTNWTSGMLYELDWGTAFGRMVRFRYPGGYASNCILPKLPNGDAEIMISVMSNEVDVLSGSECLGKYLSI